MNSLIKGSKLVVIDKCGHVPQEEMAERVVDEVAKFIKLHGSGIKILIGRLAIESYGGRESI